LPNHILSGIVKLVFDNNKLSALIKSQQIKALVCIRKAIKLLLDDQKVFTEDLRVIDDPLL
jgi:hypothetical protein